MIDRRMLYDEEVNELIRQLISDRKCQRVSSGWQYENIYSSSSMAGSPPVYVGHATEKKYYEQEPASFQGMLEAISECFRIENKELPSRVRIAIPLIIGSGSQDRSQPNHFVALVLDLTGFKELETGLYTGDELQVSYMDSNSDASVKCPSWLKTVLSKGFFGVDKSDCIKDASISVANQHEKGSSTLCGEATALNLVAAAFGGQLPSSQDYQNARTARSEAENGTKKEEVMDAKPVNPVADNAAPKQLVNPSLEAKPEPQVESVATPAPTPTPTPAPISARNIYGDAKFFEFDCFAELKENSWREWHFNSVLRMLLGDLKGTPVTAGLFDYLFLGIPLLFKYASAKCAETDRQKLMIALTGAYYLFYIPMYFLAIAVSIVLAFFMVLPGKLASHHEGAKGSESAKGVASSLSGVQSSLDWNNGHLISSADSSEVVITTGGDSTPQLSAQKGIFAKPPGVGATSQEAIKVLSRDGSQPKA